MTSTTATEATPAQIREWAKAQNISVGDRGRISADLREKYKAAHQ